MSNIVIIGSRLKKIREIRGKSANEVAADLNMKQSTYSNYETGRRCPRADIVLELCEYFDVEPNFIYGVSDIPYSMKTGAAEVKQRLEEYKEAEKALETISKYMSKHR